ncbi:hypothetical protein NLU13_2183 [Sarocladium strictum]|uniref:DNA polymerase V n=1 Tax=Sarocladium strictum TaxID=5046 RepID=A0AA39LCX6_SARSR|nr:hypothetical protein NLU13_2183 [Sarocladium strictum]
MGKNKKRAAPAADHPAPKKAKTSISIADIPAGPFVDAPSKDERKREGELYELLSSIDENDRKAASDRIVSTLLGSDGEEGVPETVLERHICKRLIRGLASSRKAARVGFSLALTELLHQLFGPKKLAQSTYTGLTFEKLWNTYLESTAPVGGVAAQEERDHAFGRLFGMYAFVRSTALFDEPSRWEPALDILLDLGQEKAWMRSQCGFTIVEAMRQMDQNLTKSTLRRIAEKGQAKTPEGVAIWLAASSRFPNLKVQPWNHPLAKESLATLTAVLKESYNLAKEEGEDTQTSKQAGWTRDPHFVWDLILRYYALDELAPIADFERFWTTVVDGGFFSKKASDGQKFSGFMIFQKMLSGFAASDESLASGKLQCLFSKNMLDCLMNQASQSDRFVYRAAIHTLKSIENAASSQPHILPNVLRRLLSSHGAYNFDIRTKTKTIDKLLRLIGNGNENHVLQAVREPLAQLKTVKPAADGKKNSEAEQMIRAFIEYLTKIIHALVVDTSSDLDVKNFKQSAILDSLKDLASIANSQSELVPAALVSDNLRDLARERLETSLGKLAKFCGQYKIFCCAIEELDLGTARLDEELAAAKEDALARMKKLLKQKSADDGTKQSLSQGLAMLYAVSIFRLYNEDADAMEVLSDLAEQAPEKGAAGVQSSEFLVEILLSMVTRSSLLMREVSHQVFGALSSQISEEGLDLLLEPLSAPENVQGQKELFNTEDDDVVVDGDEDDDSEDDDVEVIDVEDASDVEISSDTQFVSLNGQGEDDGEDESESESEDDEDEGAADEQDKEMQELDAAIGNILKSHRLDKDADAESSDNDEDMSDSEMLALDEKLTEVFKQRTKARPDSTKDKRQAKRTVVDFKNRILDLLEIYVRNEVGNPLALNLLLPLLRLIRTTKEKQLATRAHGVIAEFKRAGKKAKGGKRDKDSGSNVAPQSSNPAKVDTEKLMEMLAEIHEEARKEAGNSHVTAASMAALKVVTAIMAADRGMHERIIALYSKTLAAWPHCKGRTQFQHYWNSWVPPKA